MLVKDNYKCTWYGKEITEAEYNKILDMLRNIPEASSGYGYRLKEDLEWELYELPTVEELEEEATEEDYLDALEQLGVYAYA